MIRIEIGYGVNQDYIQIEEINFIGSLICKHLQK